MTASQRLDEARAARHRLLTGQMEAEIRTAEGESVKYAAADLPRLDAYIAELETRLYPARRPRSIKVIY